MKGIYPILLMALAMVACEKTTEDLEPRTHSVHYTFQSASPVPVTYCDANGYTTDTITTLDYSHDVTVQPGTFEILYLGADLPAWTSATLTIEVDGTPVFNDAESAGSDGAFIGGTYNLNY